VLMKIWSKSYRRMLQNKVKVMANQSHCRVCKGAWKDGSNNAEQPNKMVGEHKKNQTLRQRLGHVNSVLSDDICSRCI
jgi:hypothetical protein